MIQQRIVALWFDRVQTSLEHYRALDVANLSEYYELSSRYHEGHQDSTDQAYHNTFDQVGCQADLDQLVL